MVTKFERPENLIAPQTYYSFKARDINSDELVDYHVQDLTEQHYEKAVELIQKYLTPEETFQKAVHLSERDFAPLLLKFYFEHIFNKRVSLACFNTKKNELVALNALEVKTKGHKEENDVSL